MLDVAALAGHRPLHGRLTRTLARLPGNQILEVEATEKELTLARLPAALDGLTVVHLSDLHFLGGLTREFYHVVVDHANAWEADLVASRGICWRTPAACPGSGKSWAACPPGTVATACGATTTGTWTTSSRCSRP